jgi:hypothetical protein
MRVVKNKSVTMETNKEDPSKVPNEPKPAADAAKPLIIDFDGTWKAIIAEFFEDFMAFPYICAENNAFAQRFNGAF